MACRERLALGAYLLGSLDPAERSAVERHVVRCADCQAELQELAPLVELMQHLPFEESPQTVRSAWGPGSGRAAPGPALEPGRTADALSRVVRRTRIRRVLVGCALVVSAAVAGVGIHLGARAPQPVAVRPAALVSATDPATHVKASAALTPDLTGTSIRLRMSGLPPAVCRLVVHARDGRTETAVGWTSGYASAISVPGSTSLRVRDISRLDVVTGRGRLLVELRPR
ncbi:anti-sigma factor [Streptomyces sp. YIM S03343]